MTYTGSVQRGRLHGHGTLHFLGHGSYTGGFVDGAMTDPRAELTFANGDVYRGAVRDGYRVGLSEWEFASGTRFKGTTTQGTAEWPTCTYTGQFKDGKCHGWGTCRWKNGNLYEGEWYQGMRHGEGTFVFADGSIFKGIWESNERVRPKVTSRTESSRRAERLNCI